MKVEIVVTGILKDEDKFLIIKRNDFDDKYPGLWEFPGGHLEYGETLKDALKRELFEEIGFNLEFNPTIINYYDEIREINGELVHEIEFDFIINISKSKVDVTLSKEHTNYRWVTKDSSYLDDFIRNKLSNI